MMKKIVISDSPVRHPLVVKEVTKEMLTDDLFFCIARFYKILGDMTRMKVLYALDKKEMCVGDIANLLKMSKSAISHQLKLLRQNKIVRGRKEGKEVYYSLDDEHVQKVIEIGIEHINHQKKGKQDEK